MLCSSLCCLTVIAKALAFFQRMPEKRDHALIHLKDGQCMGWPRPLTWDPDMQVHYGMVLPSGKRQAPPDGLVPWGSPIDEECATWLHLVNLFVGRDNRTTHEVDTRWQWVFDGLSGYRMQQHSTRRLLSHSM